MDKKIEKTVEIDGRSVPIDGERNILELVRKAGVELPTFCYHSELSVYGACRLCLVDVKGRGIVAACSTPPEPGMRVATSTEEIRGIRRVSVELLLASHEQSCPTCAKSATCKLLDLSRRLGVRQTRYKPLRSPAPVDNTGPSLVRDPNKCVLCGDCVRMCSEIQGIGAIDFVHRGAKAAVAPAFGKNLEQVECVYCGQCAAVCPTSAIMPKPALDGVWAALGDPRKKVVVQVAPAVRAALGERFGAIPGMRTSGKMVAALRALGFDAVYDTAFTADLTVREEAEEFIARKTRGERIPQFTSCCPAWVKYAEQYHPELLPNLSTCRSPQQMFGSVAKKILPSTLGVDAADLVVVSVMPCTAKKFEAGRPEFAEGGVPDVDHVLTTQELAVMIEERGIRFEQLEADHFDQPFGAKSGAGIIFGVSGGVSEAVLRYASERLGGARREDFVPSGGDDASGAIVYEAEMGGGVLRLAVVSGLAKAKKLIEEMRAGRAAFDLVEVMACPGGCVNGAGQPTAQAGDSRATRRRAEALRADDRGCELRAPQDNPFIHELYEKHLGKTGGKKAHHMLHTCHKSRRRLDNEPLAVGSVGKTPKTSVSVCVGTSCFVRGSQKLLRGIIEHVEAKGLRDEVDIAATFCHERCAKGPTVIVNGEIIERCTIERAIEAVSEAREAMPV